MYYPVKFGCKRISGLVNMVGTVTFDYMSPYSDFDLEDNKAIFSHYTLAHDNASPFKVWLQKVKWLRINILSEQTFINILNLHCGLDLECSNPFLS